MILDRPRCTCLNVISSKLQSQVIPPNANRVVDVIVLAHVPESVMHPKTRNTRLRNLLIPGSVTIQILARMFAVGARIISVSIIRPPSNVSSLLLLQVPG